jgi:Na+/melibiose symporter-like transporter
MHMRQPERELGWRALAAYALPALPLAILQLPFYVIVPAFYAREGLAIAAVGQALLVVRIVDAFSDPAVGLMADRWRPAFGRRRIWVALAAPLVAFAAWQLMRPPTVPSALYLGLWGCVLSVVWTACLVPYMAWGAELSRTYAGRTRVAAARETLTVVGTLLALAMPAALPALGFEGERATLSTFALMIGIGLPLTAWLAVAAVAEPVERSTRRLPLAEGLRHMRANTPFVRLLAAYFVNGFANGLPATLFLFFVGDKLGAPDQAGPLLVLYFICGVAGVPFWLWLARRTSKHRAWAIGMVLACAAFLPAPWLGGGDVIAFALVCVGTGLALGADVVLPSAIQADVIDLDTAASGEERSGLYLGAWALATKLALAAGVGLAFPLLGAFGFDPAKGLKTAEGLMALGLLYAGLPVILKLGAIALMWRFPLDQASADEVARRIGRAVA